MSLTTGGISIDRRLTRYELTPFIEYVMLSWENMFELST